MAGHVQKQLSSQKQWTKPDKSEREAGYLKRVEEKKKEKPKTAPAGGGMKPPNKPPKGPTGGPKNPKNIGKGNEPDDHVNKKPKGSREEEKKRPKSESISPQFPKNDHKNDIRRKENDRMSQGNKPKDYKAPDVKITRDQKGHSNSMGKGKGTPTTPNKDKQFSGKREESYNPSIGKNKKK